MEVTGVTNVAKSPSAAAASAAAKSTELDSKAFMQILMAQLTHQNPLEPMDSNEMMNQFSQLNSLQELRDIHSAMDKVTVTNQTSYLASLIGKTVKAKGSDGRVLEGVVDGVIAEGDNPKIRIGDDVVALKDVTEIKGE